MIKEWVIGLAIGWIAREILSWWKNNNQEIIDKVVSIVKTGEEKIEAKMNIQIPDKYIEDFKNTLTYWRDYINENIASGPVVRGFLRHLAKTPASDLKNSFLAKLDSIKDGITLDSIGKLMGSDEFKPLVNAFKHEDVKMNVRASMALNHPTVPEVKEEILDKAIIGAVEIGKIEKPKSAIERPEEIQKLVEELRIKVKSETK